MTITFAQLRRAVEKKLEEVFGPGLPHLDGIAYHFARILAHNLGIVELEPEEYAEHLKALRRLLAGALAEWQELLDALAEALEELGVAAPEAVKQFHRLLLKKAFYEMGWVELTREELAKLLAELEEAAANLAAAISGKVSIIAGVGEIARPVEAEERPAHTLKAQATASEIYLESGTVYGAEARVEWLGPAQE